jgi:hypothetical protein
MSDDFNTFTNTEVIPGIIAAIASFAVCITFAAFPELRCLRYVELVFYVALNDMIASIGISLGNTKNGSAACWFQGISTNYNYLSAVLWSTVITYQVWLVVCRKNVIKDLTIAHYICWGFPLVVTLLPLSTSTYANPDDDAGWCFVADRAKSPRYGELLWFLLAYYGWIWLAMGFNVFFICTILYKIYKMQQVPDKVVATIRKLLLYPVVITICWAPSTVWDLCSQVSTNPSSNSWEAFDSVASILAISQGFLFAWVFFGMNRIVRKSWWDLFVSMGCCSCCSGWGSGGSAQTRDDKSVVSMVSVSIKSTTASEGGSVPEGDPNARPSGRRSTGGLSFLGGSSFNSNGSWYARPTVEKLQEEVDFIPAGDGRMSQRLSVLDFLSADGPAGMLGALSFGLSRSAQHTVHSSGTSANPLNMSMAIDENDTGSELQSVGTGTATMSVRRAQEDGLDSHDEESGITSVTGPSNGRMPSISSVGTLSTQGTKRSKGVTFVS